MSLIHNGSVSLKIADLTLSLEQEDLVSVPPRSYQGFLHQGECEFIIRAHQGLPTLPLHRENRVFDSGEVWSLYRAEGEHVFVLRSPLFGSEPYRIARFKEDFREGDVYTRVVGMDPPFVSHPLEYPLAEVLMVCLLSRGRGLMIHACGVDDGGHGYLFAGNSTHGKTTIARILTNKGAHVLNDDRIVLRERDGRLWMFGTPWHGEYSQVSPQGVPLERIFFINHGEGNAHSQVNVATGASMLLTRSFPPIWDRQGMAYTLQFVEQIVRNTPCHRLAFRPDGEIVDFVRCVS